MDDNVTAFPTQPLVESMHKDFIAELDDLRTMNHAALQDLQSRGMSINPSDILSLRIELIYNQLVGFEGSPRRVQLELEFERTVKEMLEQGLTQVFAAQLAGATPAGQQRKSGLFVP